MAGYKTPDFNDRAAAARTVKERALDMLRNKEAPDPAGIAELQSACAASETAAAERRAVRQFATEGPGAARPASRIPPLGNGDGEAQTPKRLPRNEMRRRAARHIRHAARMAGQR